MKKISFSITDDFFSPLSFQGNIIGSQNFLLSQNDPWLKKVKHPILQQCFSNFLPKNKFL